MSAKHDVAKIVKKAKDATHKLAVLKTSVKNKVLRSMAHDLIKFSKVIKKANDKDVKRAARNRRSAAFIDRLMLCDKRIRAMSSSLKNVAKLEDPVGKVSDARKRPNGLTIGQMRVPIGVIAIIYESRPNVTSDCVGLCLKSGNAVILRGGSDSINSNIAVFEVLNRSIKKFGLPEGSINIVRNTSHGFVRQLLKQNKYVDLVMPRGGEKLIEEVANNSRIPVIKHYKGVCHVYVDSEANLNMAHKIAINAKVQRPGVCNAMETLLVHRHVAARFIPVLVNELKSLGVEIRGCNTTRRIAKNIKAAKEKDWYTEYLDLILSVKVVRNIDEAVAHIRKYGSQHSDAIITANRISAKKFLREVDSAAVYVNASTRFTDGGEFGMGAEIGISTDRLHARGPMALKELTTYKYIILGKGQIRS